MREEWSLANTIVWDALGFLCLVVILKILPRIRELLRGIQIKYKITTLLIGMLSGVAGTLFAAYAFFSIDIYFDYHLTNHVPFPSLTVLATLLISFGTYFVALAAECLMPKFCRREATIGVALITSAILLAQPVYYGWVIRVFKFCFNFQSLLKWVHL